MRGVRTQHIVLVAREPLRPWQGDYTNFLDQHFISLSPDWIESIETHGRMTLSCAKKPTDSGGPRRTRDFSGRRRA